jgi:hypothetical protein
MKGITKAQVKKDMAIIDEMATRYINGIYGETNFRPEDWEQQFKQVMIAMPIIAEYLKRASEHMYRLSELPLVDHPD